MFFCVMATPSKSGIDCESKKRKELCSASSEDSFVSTPSPVRKVNKTCALSTPDNLQSISNSDMSMEENIKKINETLVSLSARLSTLQTKEDANVLADSLRDSMDKMKNDLAEMCNNIRDKVETFDARVMEVEDRMDNLEKENESLREKNCELLDRVERCEAYQNELEQYTRRWNLRVFRVPEEKNETERQTAQKVCNLFTDVLKVNTTPNDFEACHRLGNVGQGGTGTKRKNKDGARAIIIRFKPGSRDLRDRILKTRSDLKKKNNPASISEDLTKGNADLLKACYDHPECESSWSINGKIFAKLKNEVKFRVPYGVKVNDFFRMKLAAPIAPQSEPVEQVEGQQAVTQSQTEDNNIEID